LIARGSGTRQPVGLLLDHLCDKLFVLLALSGCRAAGSLDGVAFVILMLRDLYTAGC